MNTKALDVAVSTLIFLVSLELGLRILGFYNTPSEATGNGEYWTEWGYTRDTAHYSYEPNSSFKLSNHEAEWQYKTNSLGYREYELDSTKRDNLRVFVLGDSFVEGVGADYNETWVRVLEQSLKNTNPLSSVYACGMAGSDPFYQRWTLENILMYYEPTHVILTINDTDFDDFTIRGGDSRFQPNGGVKYNAPPSILRLYRHSYLIRLVVHELMGYDIHLINRSEGIKQEQQKRAAIALAECLTATDRFCASRNIKFLAIVHPVPHSICFEDQGVKTEVTALDSLYFDFPVLRMYRPLKAAMQGADCRSYHWTVDSHFNPKGYELFGNLVFQEIQKQVPDFWNQPGRDTLSASVN
jgi:hypothetical protein